MREQEAKDKEGLAKEARLREHLAKETKEEKMKATRMNAKTEKTIKVKEPNVNQSKSGEDGKKRPVATPQVATQQPKPEPQHPKPEPEQPKPEPAIVRKSSSMEAVADALNRSHTNDMSPPTPPPCSVTRSHGALENAKGDTEKDEESSDEEIPNPHKDLEDIPTETHLAMVSKGPKKRTKEQLAVHRKKQSFYRTLVSTGLMRSYVNSI